MHYLQNTNGMMKGLTVYSDLENWDLSAFLVRNLPFTPNLEELRLHNDCLNEQEESSAQVYTQQLFGSLADLRKLSLISTVGVHFNFSGISELEKITFEHLKQLRLHKGGPYQAALKRFDKDLENLVEACPKLEDSNIGSARGLQAPVIKSTSLQTIDLDIHIQKTLTVDAPLLCYIRISGVPLGASIRSGGRPLSFDTYGGDFGPVQFWDPASVDNLNLRGRWEKVELTRLLKSCCKATHIIFNAGCRLKDGQSKLDLLELLSHLSSLKILWINGLGMMESVRGYACTPSRQVGERLEQLRFCLTEEEQKNACSRMVEAAVNLRSLILQGADEKVEQSLLPYQKILQNRHPYLDITVQRIWGD
jgi:hypothetical protein